jgi:hypothetical protein
MEVHHHAHTSRKKWTHYFWEFLMLFLAVFCGFLAENFREHKIEKLRAKEHMHTMFENLKYDTTRYRRNLEFNVRNMFGLDSFRYQLNEAIEGRIDVNKLYYFFLKYGRGAVHGVPNPNESAISQLRSSGLIRMIRNDQLVNEIGDYYSRRIPNLDRLRIKVFNKQDILDETYKSFFSLRGFEQIYTRDEVWTSSLMTIGDRYVNGVLNTKAPLKLLSTDPEKLERLYSDISDMEQAIGIYNAVIRANHQAADNLMKQIKDEYGVK